MVLDREAWHAAVHGVAKSDMTELLSFKMEVPIDTVYQKAHFPTPSPALNKFLKPYQNEG